MTTTGITGRQELQATLARYSWYHTIELMPGLSTPGIRSLAPLVEHLKSTVRALEVSGQRVLDVGARDGALAFEAERAGAREVVAIDNDLSPGAVEVLIPYFQSNVKMIQMNLLDLTPERHGRFDIVLCCGVLYHLRYPFWGLRALASVVEDGGLLVLETGMLVDDNTRPLLYCPTGAESPYEHTSPTFFNEKGLQDTLATLGLTLESVAYHKPLPYTRARRWKDGIRLALGKPPITRINRAVLQCRKHDDLSSPLLRAYWDGTHEIHTTMYMPEWGR
jgi:SAM-dependent methyltransferase